MGLIELVLYIVLIALVLQLVFSFVTVDRRIVGIVIVIVILVVFFGHRGRHFRLFSGNSTPSSSQG